MGPLNDSHVCLQRDALSTPWGFRLQGGKDFKAPLTVQRVFVGSPADGELHRGDVILGINGYDAANMIHKQAQDLIKNAGGTINLVVRHVQGGPARGVVPLQSRTGYHAPPPADTGFRSRGLDTFTPKPAPPIGSVVTNAHIPMQNYNQPQSGFVLNQFGSDYGRSNSVPSRPRGPPQQGSMLSKVQDSLTSNLYTGYPEHNGEENYQPMPVNQLKQVFAQPQQLQVARPRSRPQSNSPIRPAWSKPTDRAGVLADPGWSPVKAPSAPRYPPPAQVPVNSSQLQSLQPSYQQPQRPDTDPNFRPAWAGSLKSSGGPKQWEVREQTAIATGGPAPPIFQEHHAVQPHQPRVQNVNYGPGGASPQYQQQGDQAASSNATVAHKQYNTPIGLYSKGNVQEVLTGQTQGRPGEGTMQVTGGGPGGKKLFDPNRSEVLRLLQEEERPQPRGHGLPPSQQSPGQSARYQNQAPNQEMQYGGYMDPSKQSPMMHALEDHMASVQVGDGLSDF